MVVVLVKKVVGLVALHLAVQSTYKGAVVVLVTLRLMVPVTEVVHSYQGKRVGAVVLPLQAMPAKRMAGVGAVQMGLPLVALGLLV